MNDPHPSHTLLTATDDAATQHPYIAISSSVMLLTRLSVLTVLVIVYVVAFTGYRYAAPFAPLRLLLLTVYIGTFTFPLWYRLKSVGLFHPLFVLSSMSFLTGLTDISAWALGVDFHPRLVGMPRSAIALLDIKILGIKTLSWICIYIGFFSVRGIKWKAFRIQESNFVCIVLGALAVAISVFSLYQLVQFSGGFMEHMKNITRGYRGKVYVKDSDFISVYATLVPLIVVAPALMILRGKYTFVNPLFWSTSVLSVIFAFLVNGRRSAVVMVMLIQVACWVLRRRSVALGRLTIIGFVIFLSVGILGDYRRSNWNRNPNVTFESFTSTDFQSAFASTFTEIEARRRGGAVMPIVQYVPEKVPYMYGKNYLDYFNRFIPRFIWKDKPRGIGITCAEVFYRRYNQGGIPPGGIGEAWWSGGIIGVIAVFTLWGVFLKSIGNFFVQFKYSALASMVYLATVTRLGPSETQFRGWLYMVAPVIVLMLITGTIRLRAPPSD